jgi:hypothetical protein
LLLLLLEAANVQLGVLYSPMLEDLASFNCTAAPLDPSCTAGASAKAINVPVMHAVTAAAAAAAATRLLTLAQHLALAKNQAILVSCMSQEQNGSRRSMCLSDSCHVVNVVVQVADLSMPRCLLHQGEHNLQFLQHKTANYADEAFKPAEPLCAAALTAALPCCTAAALLPS